MRQDIKVATIWIPLTNNEDICNWESVVNPASCKKNFQFFFHINSEDICNCESVVKPASYKNKNYFNQNNPFSLFSENICGLKSVSNTASYIKYRMWKIL